MSRGPSLTIELAARFAGIAVENVAQEYPHKLDHVMASDADVLPPRALHPAFHASYDWHSCVHMHWLLVHLRDRFPCLPQARAIEEVCALHFSADAIAVECAYLAQPNTQSFGRTYGWAWLLKLATELAACRDAIAKGWSAALAPLAAAIEARYLGYLPKADYPIRHGMHPNSAFGLLLALEYARATSSNDLAVSCAAKAREWYGSDTDAPARWEPSGADFLSPVLMEAALMGHVLERPDFDGWLTRFLPGLARGEPATLFAPVHVSDRDDPQIVHLDGLNLSRAWCWRQIADALPAADARARVARDAAATHLQAGLAGVDAATYVGSHWLASFAALALIEAS